MEFSTESDSYDIGLVRIIIISAQAHRSEYAIHAALSSLNN